MVNKIIQGISELSLKITEKKAWLSAASVKQQVAGQRSAFLNCSSQQCNCIYFLHARALEDINRRSGSQMLFKTGISKISQNSEGRQPWSTSCNFTLK